MYTHDVDATPLVLAKTGVEHHALSTKSVWTEVQGPWHPQNVCQGPSLLAQIRGVFQNSDLFLVKFIRNALDFYHLPARIDLEAWAKLKELDGEAGAAAIFPANGLFSCFWSLSIFSKDSAAHLNILLRYVSRGSSPHGIITGNDITPQFSRA